MDNSQLPLFFESDRCPEFKCYAPVFGPTGNNIRGDKWREEVMADTTANTDRPLKANGQAGTLARYLISYPGNSLTVQRADAWLKQHNLTSNDVGRRLREARRYLEREGLTVTETDCGGYKSWQVEWDLDKVQEVRKKLTLGRNK